MYIGKQWLENVTRNGAIQWDKMDEIQRLVCVRVLTDNDRLSLLPDDIARELLDDDISLLDFRRNPKNYRFCTALSYNGEDLVGGHNRIHEKTEFGRRKEGTLGLQPVCKKVKSERKAYFRDKKEKKTYGQTKSSPRKNMENVLGKVDGWDTQDTKKDSVDMKETMKETFREMFLEMFLEMKNMKE